MIISGVIGGFAALWVFTSESDGAMVRHAQSFTPFGAALLAIVTFFTVAWRGVLNTRQLQHQAEQLVLQNRQLDHQASQIDLQTRQLVLQTKQLELQTQQVVQQTRANDTSDQANLARLLQEGAKLLGEKEKEPQILGGIVTLEMLVVEKNRFSVSAMNLLLDFVERSYDKENLKSAVLSAREVMARGARRGIRASFSADFRSDDATYAWFGIRGAGKTEYWGGRFYQSAYSNLDGRGWLNDLTLINCRIRNNDDWSFYRCTFHQCDFTDIVVPTVIGCKFTECIFSNADVASMSEASLVSGNQYMAGRPPISGNNVAELISEVLVEPKWMTNHIIGRSPELAYLDG